MKVAPAEYPYLQRYLDGDYEAVWSELIGLGEEVQHPPIYGDADAVARETMRRVRKNLETIYKRLLELDYMFDVPEEAFVPAHPNATDTISAFEQDYGVLPISARAWYETVHSLNFSQAWEQKNRSAKGDVAGLGYGTDLIIYPLPKAEQEAIGYLMQHRLIALMDKIDQERTVEPVDLQEEPIRLSSIPTGAAASSCDLATFSVGKNIMDCVYYYEEDGPHYFVAELRYCILSAAGFTCTKSRFGTYDPSQLGHGSPNIEKVIPFLTYDLTPF